MRNKLLLIIILFSIVATGQNTLSVNVDSTTHKLTNVLINVESIKEFYAKLNQAHSFTNQKINIVHIGDSHIQADLMTNVTRKELQKVFGNGGRGFVFPHNLAKTNGSSDVRFSSNAKWESLRNISPKSDLQIGLSGIALQTNTSNFHIDVAIKDPAYFFNTVKILSPPNFNRLAASTQKTTIVLETSVPKNIIHRIKSGDALSILADKYGTTLSAIKRLNNMKSNAIRAEKSLKIPSSETQNIKSEKVQYVPLDMQSSPNLDFYHFDVSQSTIAIIPTNKSESNLNGIILENDTNGVVYHNIGVNGAKFSDYNKYPLFFEQLAILAPDLVIVSLGTNESFDKLESTEYVAQLALFIENVRAKNPAASIVISTPPPSLFGRKSQNIYIKNYTDDIIKTATTLNFAVWDLYSILGGHDGILANATNDIIGADRVHYTKKGYEWHGKLLADAILNGLYFK